MFSDSALSGFYESGAGFTLESPRHVDGLRSVARALTTATMQRTLAAERSAERRVAAALSTARKALATAQRTPPPAPDRTIGGRVLRAAATARTVAELAAAANVTRAQAQSAVQRLRKAGKLKRSGASGSYCYEAIDAGLGYMEGRCAS